MANSENTPRRWHFAGICGIGMSGLAQFARSRGFQISGSDRGLERSENAGLKRALLAQGVELFPQDGSAFAAGLPRPDAVIYSSAIEENNPDFAASSGIERIHRATALCELIQAAGAGSCTTIAIAGSCGKTSTTALVAEALYNLGMNPCCIDGGMVKAFATEEFPGNFRGGTGPLVFEADESDKSLLTFHPDIAVVLNIGTDHYPKAELAAMFAQFVNQAKRGAVLSESVYETLKDLLREGLEIRTFSEDIPYRAENGQSLADFGGGFSTLPAPGKHTAWNVMAATGVLELLGAKHDAALAAALDTHGVARRFDLKGVTANGAVVYDDYAHNPEKIATCIAAAQELSGAEGRLFAIFQPHGYGPFGFMRDELGKVLHHSLRAQDLLILFEPYYAGGTSSFQPSAPDVLADWHQRYPELPAVFEAKRSGAEKRLADARRGDVILVMGARDNTLAEWSASFCSVNNNQSTYQPEGKNNA